MSQAEARSWWADVEHLREAAERRHADDAARRRGEDRPRQDPAEARARARAAARVQAAGAGRVDDLSARRAVASDERAPRPRRPAPIWLADDAFADPVATARARASAPRRTVEIRGQLVPNAQARPLTDVTPAPRVRSRERTGISLAAVITHRPDRVAFWAFALGLALAIAAAASPH
jgi:hypothetical protein